MMHAILDDEILRNLTVMRVIWQTDRTSLFHNMNNRSFIKDRLDISYQPLTQCILLKSIKGMA